LSEKPISWLFSRRSVRRFLNQPVPQSVINLLLEAAIQAPSAHNRQPARYAVIQDPGQKRLLAEAMGAAFLKDLLSDGQPPGEAQAQVERSQRRINQAPLAILVLLERRSLDIYPDEPRQQAEYLMAVQGVAMAAENLLLAAHYLDLGAVWLCAPLFTPETARKALDLPASWEPQGLILIGYPAQYPEKRVRYEVADVARFY